MAKLTPHFDIHEFRQFARHGFSETEYPKEWEQERLLPLCQVLEVIRAELGRPIKIVSGYRSPAYNKAIGGAKASQHMAGCAADIVVADLNANIVHDVILRLHKEKKIKIGGLGKYPNFCHVDVRSIKGKGLARWKGSRQS